MWRQFLRQIFPEVDVHAPAPLPALDSAEERLEAGLPPDLRELLRETNGVQDEDLVDVVWPVERIVADNLDFRRRPAFAELYGPFDGLIFFGDEGGGDQFAFYAHAPGKGVVVWDHETDEQSIIAAGLAEYLTGWFVHEGGFSGVGLGQTR